MTVDLDETAVLCSNVEIKHRSVDSGAARDLRVE